VWLQLSAAWANTRAQRSAEAAAQALALSRGLSAVARDPFQHYLALCACAVAASRTLDGAAAEAALADLATAEDPAWPPYRLRSGAEAAAAVAQWRGDAAALLRFERRALALEYAAGGSGVDALNNLVNAELAAGDALAAVRSGTALMVMLEGSRDELALAYARVNLAAAQLALGDLRRARELAQAGWAQAQRFDLQPLWADYLGLLAALEARPRAAARLAGYALVAYTARGDRRQANEAAAVARTRALVCTALGDGCFDRLHAEGAALTDAAIAMLAFGVEDA
jgi:hypothetical protein